MLKTICTALVGILIFSPACQKGQSGMQEKTKKAESTTEDTGLEPQDEAKKTPDAGITESAQDVEAKPDVDGDVEPTKPADAQAAIPADAEDTVAELETDGSRLAQCKAIVGKCFEAVQPALVMLRVENNESFEADYKKSAATFLTRCQKLSEKEIECLSGSENPLSGIDICRINEGKKSIEKIFAPDISKHIRIFNLEKARRGQSKKIFSRLKGKWVNNWKEARTHTTWIIKKSGEVAQRKKGPGDKTEQKHFRISFEYSGRMTVHWSESSSQRFVFFMPGRRVLYTSGNLTYDFYPVENRKDFVVRDSGDYIFFRSGKCKVVSDRGLMTEGKCNFTKKRGRRVFSATWQYPGQVFLDGSPRVLKRDYYLIGKHLADERLIKSGKFKKI